MGASENGCEAAALLTRTHSVELVVACSTLAGLSQQYMQSRTAHVSTFAEVQRVREGCARGESAHMAVGASRRPRGLLQASTCSMKERSHTHVRVDDRRHSHPSSRSMEMGREPRSFRVHFAFISRAIASSRRLPCLGYLPTLGIRTASPQKGALQNEPRRSRAA